jgi:L-ornithine Nalpha-acyltransferase
MLSSQHNESCDMPHKIYERGGDLEIRLAKSLKDVRRAQRVRYKVFYKEMKAHPSPLNRLLRRDMDAYDVICDHLLVCDMAKKRFFKKRPKVVGTYRLLRQTVVKEAKGFYSANEFEVETLVARHPHLNFLELGRSCVLKDYRKMGTIELLWAGIWAYVQKHKCDVLMGCASFPTTDVEHLKEELSFLYHYARAQGEWAVEAKGAGALPMNLLPKEEINAKKVMNNLPPLIKAYLRIGAKFGETAIVDKEFGTIDVFVVLPVAAIGAKYIKHYS